MRRLSLRSEILFIYFYTRRLIRVDLKNPQSPPSGGGGNTGGPEESADKGIVANESVGQGGAASASETNGEADLS